MAITGGYVITEGGASTDYAMALHDFQTTLFAYAMTVRRIAGGRYRVTLDSPHPDGDNYPVLLSGEQSDTGPNNRDNPKVTLVRGSRNANGFEVMVTIDDNGGSPDTYVDLPFSVVVKKQP